LLVDRKAFVSWPIEGLFPPIMAAGNPEWAGYLRDRYDFLKEGKPT